MSFRTAYSDRNRRTPKPLPLFRDETLEQQQKRREKENADWKRRYEKWINEK